MDINTVKKKLTELNDRITASHPIVGDEYRNEFEQAIAYYKKTINLADWKIIPFTKPSSIREAVAKVREKKLQIATNSYNVMYYHELYYYANEGLNLIRKEAEKVNRAKDDMRAKYRKFILSTLKPELEVYKRSIEQPLQIGNVPLLGVLYHQIPIVPEFETPLKECSPAYSSSLKAIGEPFFCNCIRITTKKADEQSRVVGKIADYIDAILYIASESPARWRALYMDCEAYTEGEFGRFSDVSDSTTWSFMAPVPHTWNEAENTLGTFLELVRAEDKPTRRFIIIKGWEKLVSYPAFTGMLQEKEKLGFCILLIDSLSGNSTQLPGIQHKHFICENNFLITSGNDMGFLFFFDKRVKTSASLKQKVIKNYARPEVSYRYLDYARFNPSYTSSKGGSELDIRLLYGADEDGNLCYYDTYERIGGTRFCTYILGGAGSGKTTLLHTFISSLIFNYHPDDMELWLIDFAAVEFRKYAEHTPPHVKYVMLDNNSDMVFSLIRQIETEMERRQKIFGANSDIRSARAANPTESIPYIFIIVDEFPFMSETLVESASTGRIDYLAKFENIIRQTRKLGFRYIFAGQKYGMSSATRALDRVKENVTGRLAMYSNDKSEIKDLLDTKTTGIEMADALPVHKVLERYENPPLSGQNYLKYVNVFYMDKGHNDEQAYFDGIDALRKNIRWQDKAPVIVDPAIGVQMTSVLPDIKINRAQLEGKSGGILPLILYPGVARSLERIVPVILTRDESESDQNLLVLGNKSQFTAELCRVIKSIVYYANMAGHEIDILSGDNDILLKHSILDNFLKTNTNISSINIFFGREDTTNRIESISQDLCDGKRLNRLVMLLDPFVLLKPKPSFKDRLGGSGSAKKSGSTAITFLEGLEMRQEDTPAGLSTAEKLAIIMQDGCHEGINFVCIANSVNELKQAQAEFIFKHSKHLLSFKNGMQGDLDLDRVNKQLNEQSHERCFVYDDSFHSYVMEAFI